VERPELHRAPSAPIAPDAAEQLLNQSKPLAPLTVEDCEALLNTKGWSTVAMVCIRNGKTMYIVTCTRRAECIFGKGETQREAWQDAVKQAE